MRIFLVHLKCMFMELLRMPAYVIPTIFFPPMFFLIFAQPNAEDSDAAGLLTASFAAFAVLGVVFFQFGVLTAKDRSSTWAYYLRTLPVTVGHTFAARFSNALIFAILTAGVTVLVCKLSTPLTLSWEAWARFGFALIAGAVPFIFMGFTLGYFVRADDAVPISNLLYLPLSFAGGLWMPPEVLPKAVQNISIYLPSRHYGELVWAATASTPWETKNWLVLLGYAMLFLILSVIGYKRDKKQRFA